MDYLLEFKKYIEELTSLLACKYVEEILTQQNKLIVLNWLLVLDSEYEVIPSQIFSSKVDNLIGVFSRVMQSFSVESRPTTTNNDFSDRLALDVESGGRGYYHNGGKESCDVLVQCFGCGEFGHNRNHCPHGQANPRFANTVSQSDPLNSQNEGYTLVMSDDEFNRYT